MNISYLVQFNSLQITTQILFSDIVKRAGLSIKRHFGQVYCEGQPNTKIKINSTAFA